MKNREKKTNYIAAFKIVWGWAETEEGSEGIVIKNKIKIEINKIDCCHQILNGI